VANDKDKPQVTKSSNLDRLSADEIQAFGALAKGPKPGPSEALDILAANASAGHAAYEAEQAKRRAAGISRVPPPPPRLDPNGGSGSLPKSRIDDDRENQQHLRASIVDAIEQQGRKPPPPPPPSDPPRSAPEPPPSPKAGDHEHHPTTKTLDYLGLGIILAPAPEVIAMYLRHEDIDWKRVAISFLVSIPIGSAILWLARAWPKTAGGLASFKGQINRADDYFIVRAAIIAFFMIVPVLIAPLVSGAPVQPSPAQPGFTQQQIDEKIAAATAAIKDQLNIAARELDETKHQLEVIKRNPAASIPPPPPPDTTDSHGLIQWEPRLSWAQSADASGTIFLALTFSGHNRFKAVQLKNAYIQSGITGERRSLLIDAGYDGRFSPSESNPIPADAPINLVAPFSPPLRIRDFIDKWRKIDFVAEYDDTNFTMKIGEDQIFGMLRGFPDSGLGPRATKKSAQ
jgi:hypothetical protein